MYCNNFRIIRNCYLGFKFVRHDAFGLCLCKHSVHDGAISRRCLCPTCLALLNSLQLNVDRLFCVLVVADVVFSDVPDEFDIDMLDDFAADTPPLQPQGNASFGGLPPSLNFIHRTMSSTSASSALTSDSHTPTPFTPTGSTPGSGTLFSHGSDSILGPTSSAYPPSGVTGVADRVIYVYAYNVIYLNASTWSLATRLLVRSRYTMRCLLFRRRNRHGSIGRGP